MSDPVGAGLIASFARPGGHVTGVTGTNPFETYTKQIQFLKEAVPRAKRIAFLWNPANATSIPAVKAVKDSAQTLGVELQVFGARPPEEFEPAFRTLTQARIDVLLVAQEALFAIYFPRLADLSLKHRLPTICGLDGYAKARGLMTCSVALADRVRRVASYVDRLLQGANPAELPVEQPTKFELVINLKTARALGLTIPPSLLLQADQVIKSVDLPNSAFKSGGAQARRRLCRHRAYTGDPMTQRRATDAGLREAHRVPRCIQMGRRGA